MDWLLHNPIADLHGPEFLLFYGSALFLTLFVVRIQHHVQDETIDLKTPPIPADIDPYEVAYFRNGEAGVVKLALLSLLLRGYVRHKLQNGRDLIQRHEEHPNPAHLSAIESQVFVWVVTSLEPRELLYRAKPNFYKIRAQYAPGLERKFLIRTEERFEKDAFWRISWSWLVFLIGPYKLLIALGRGRPNVGFLIGMIIVGLILFIVFNRPTRRTTLGEQTWQEIEAAFSSLRTRIVSLVAEQNSAVIMAVAVFGPAVLANTAYSYFARIFDQNRGFASASGSDTSSCASGCSSSGGSSGGSSCGGGGSSCGSGCGGCGGGGD
jgi:uncharacterized protein (TIGR04222 family)